VRGVTETMAAIDEMMAKSGISNVNQIPEILANLSKMEEMRKEYEALKKILIAEGVVIFAWLGWLTFRK